MLKSDVLNPLMALGRSGWAVVRSTTQNLLLEGSELAKNSELQQRYFIQVTNGAIEE